VQFSLDELERMSGVWANTNQRGGQVRNTGLYRFSKCKRITVGSEQLADTYRIIVLYPNELQGR